MGVLDGELDLFIVKLGVFNYWYYLYYVWGVMISELMVLKFGICFGDLIDLLELMGLGWVVFGVYYDYGNFYY